MATSFGGASGASSQPLPEDSLPEPQGPSTSASDGSCSTQPWWVSSSLQESDRVAWLASALVHEAHHQLQYDRGDVYYGPAGEHAASAVQQAFLNRIGRPDIRVYRRWRDLQGIPNAPLPGNPEV